MCEKAGERVGGGREVGRQWHRSRVAAGAAAPAPVVWRHTGDRGGQSSAFCGTTD